MNDFFESYYEIFYYSTDFSLEVYSLFLYQKYALVAMLCALVCCLLYYFLLDRPKFAAVVYWLSLLFIGAFASGIYAYKNCSDLFENANLTFANEGYLGLALGSFVLSGITYFICALFLKQLAKNVCKIPF